MYSTASRRGLGMYGSGARHGLGDAAVCDPIGNDSTEVFDESSGCWIPADPSVNNGQPFDYTTLAPTVVTTVQSAPAPTPSPAPTPYTIIPVTVTAQSVPQQLPTLSTTSKSNSLGTIALIGLALWGTFVVIDDARKRR
jgi:hypothetical protein